jgi:hypothetical protein
MSTLDLAPARPFAPGFLFAWLAIIAAAALLAALAPLRLAIVAVFLFAGPHNWLEARYFLARLPGRWGKLRGFFLLAFGGAFGLSACFAALVWWRDRFEESSWLFAYCSLQTALVAWVAALAHWRGRTNPRREWGWAWPAALLAIAAVWFAPVAWSVALVYLHPLLAVWLLDRELKRSRPAWRPALRAGLCLVPVALALIYANLADAPSIEDNLGRRIADHAGAVLLDGLPERFLVAAHAFLELLHYAVWVALMPLVGLKALPWRLEGAPLARRGPGWRRALAGLLAAGALLVVALWVGFCVDYPTTRAAYFTLALFHVLAEIPFLLRSL